MAVQVSPVQSSPVQSTDCTHPKFAVKDTNCSFIEEVVEDIVSFQSLSSGLLEARDEVYPLMEVSRDYLHSRACERKGGQSMSVRKCVCISVLCVLCVSCVLYVCAHPYMGDHKETQCCIYHNVLLCGF